MTWMLQNNETGEIIDPRTDDFALSPADLGDFDNWDDALSQPHETDLVEGFAVIDYDMLRDELVEMVEAADLCCPEQVSDAVLDATKKSGRDAGLAELERAKAADPAERRSLGIEG